MRPLNFKKEYRIFRNHGFSRIKSAFRAHRNVLISKGKKK